MPDLPASIALRSPFELFHLDAKGPLEVSGLIELPGLRVHKIYSSGLGGW